VRDHKVLLLSGPSGSGKTTFAKHLCFRLATTGSIKPHSLVRNEIGVVHEEQWEDADIWPYYFAIDGSKTLKEWIGSTLYTLAESFSTARHETVPTVLIVLDAIDKAGDEGSALLVQVLNSVKRLENVKLLLLRNTSVVTHWNIFSDVARHDMLPLLEIQRRQIASAFSSISPAEVVIGTGAAAATPAYFALASEARHRGDQAEELLDAWLALVAPDKDASDEITAQVYEYLQKDGALQSKRHGSLKRVGGSSALHHLLAARYLANLPTGTAITTFHSSPEESESILRSLLCRLSVAGRSGDLVEGLIRGSGPTAQLGALLVSDFIPESDKIQNQISSQMLAIIEESMLPILQRDKAGRVLARLGDSRDLMGLAYIPAGNFIVGSESHPNSQPLETIFLESFCIGIYPIVNREFSIFVRKIGLGWQSPDGFDLETQNAPATDLTW
jgi:iron(II)-dependent oxidoreductase